MAHYPLYTQNLSLVGVCVKRIGKDQTPDFLHGPSAYSAPKWSSRIYPQPAVSGSEDVRLPRESRPPISGCCLDYPLFGVAWGPTDGHLERPFERTATAVSQVCASHSWPVLLLQSRHNTCMVGASPATQALRDHGSKVRADPASSASQRTTCSFHCVSIGHGACHHSITHPASISCGCRYADSSFDCRMPRRSHAAKIKPVDATRLPSPAPTICSASLSHVHDRRLHACEARWCQSRSNYQPYPVLSVIHFCAWKLIPVVHRRAPRGFV